VCVVVDDLSGYCGLASLKVESCYEFLHSYNKKDKKIVTCARVADVRTGRWVSFIKILRDLLNRPENPDEHS
jgi:hypothetical protein